MKEYAMGIKRLIKRIPLIHSFTRTIYMGLIEPLLPFSGSEAYWLKRYQSNQHSGEGSFHKLAEFKSEFLNHFVSQHNIDSIIEFGCGDGNQLQLAKYPNYKGFDISPEALIRCRELFERDQTKSFHLMNSYNNEKAPLCVSLDVIYHLVEIEVFEAYMNLLMDASDQFVIIFSSNTDKQPRLHPSWVKHRNFTKWLAANKPQWELIQTVKNKFPFKGNDLTGSFSDFFVYKKIGVKP